MGDRISDGPHGTTCSSCGQCCTVLQLPFSQDDVRRMPADAIAARTRDWYLNDLRPIGWKQAKARAPWLAPPSSIMPVHAGQSLARYPSYYVCRHWDPESGACTDHANRPDVCRTYPYNGKPSLDGMRLPPACSFRVDQGEVPVTLTRKGDAG